LPTPRLPYMSVLSI